MAKEIDTIRATSRYDAEIGAYVQRGRAQQDIVNWRPAQRSADDELSRDRGVMSARAREVAWQEPYGHNALRIVADSVIGKSYRLSIKLPATKLGISDEAAHEWEQEAEQEWQRYAEGVHCGADAARVRTWTLLAHTALRSLVVDGELLALIDMKPGFEGYHTTLNLLEPERLQNPASDTVLAPGLELRHGIEIDRMGEPIAYHIRTTYPSAGTYQPWQRNGRSVETSRVLRMTEWGRHVVLHCFRHDRVGQTRGISGLVAGLKQMKMLGAFADTELERATMAASFAAVIESELDYNSAMQLLAAEGSDFGGNGITAAALDHLRNVAPYHQQMGLRYAGARVPHLVPGEKLHVVQTQLQGAQYDLFEKAMIRQLSAAFGVSAESLSRNFSDTSYSAARMSLADIWRSYEVMREMFNKQFALPFVGAWMEEAVTSGFLRLPTGDEPTLENWVRLRSYLVAGTFLSWGKPIIDPVKEYTGKQLALSMGLTTLEAEAGADGHDWDQIARQRKKETDRRNALGLNPLDADLRLTGGQPAPAPRTDGDGAE